MKKKAKRYQEGGEAEEKRRGLAASEGEKVGFLERLRMGNIDDPTSEAYRRFGAGRGRSIPAPDMTPYSETEDAKNLMRAATRETQGARAMADTDVSGMERYASEMGKGTLRQPAKRTPSRPAAKASPTRATPSMPSIPRGSYRGTQEEGDEGEDIARQAMARRVSDVDTEVSRLDKRGKKTPEGKTATGLPREARGMGNTGPTGVEKPGLFRRTVAALGGVKLPQSEYGSEPEDKRPTTRPKPYSTAAAIQSKNMGYKKGGMVSSASKRADGCAVRGKTRGRMV